MDLFKEFKKFMPTNKQLVSDACNSLLSQLDKDKIKMSFSIHVQALNDKVYEDYLNAQKIATFKFFIIIENLQVYKDFTTKLNQFKKKKFDELKKEEESLITKKKDIEDSKILLSEIEYLSRISEFNEQKINFEKKVNKLNNYLKENIEKNENIILKEIINIVKQISIKNDFDVVLSDEQYFLASENVDISGQIFNDLNNLQIKLELTKYD